MLAPSGRLLGDLSVTCLAPDQYWIVGSYYLQEWHLRYFREHLPASGVTLRNLSDEWMGFSLSGPASRELLARLVPDDLSDAALPFMAAQRRQVGLADAVIARLSLTGELGYEINVPAASLRGVWHDLTRLGRDHGLRPVGMRAQDCLRLEKGYGIWSCEFSASNTPSQCGLSRYVDYDKPGFIGRDGALADRESPPDDRLVLLALAAGVDADVGGYEPVRVDGKRVGYTTSGAYGHHVGRSLALAYVSRAALDSGAPLSVDLIGSPVAAEVMAAPPYDPSGSRLRG